LTNSSDATAAVDHDPFIDITDCDAIRHAVVVFREQNQPTVLHRGQMGV
jgi:hypothetical protein